MVKRDGECIECAPYTLPSEDRKECIKPECERREKLLPNG